MKPDEGSQALREAELRGQVALLQRRVAALEQSQLELEAFTGAVAHELRTPLSALAAFCGVLRQTLATLRDPQARSCEQYALRMDQGLQQMDDLIEAMLRLSRASTAALRCEPVDLGALAREVFDALAARDPQRPCELRVDPALAAWGDRALLRQLLDNLLGNAWKFSGRQPCVHIEVGRQPGAEGGAFFVRDRGAGFDPAQAERLFQPFERLHTAGEFPGTGIGLTTVHRIVARHGGQVRAESVPGAGATFFFTLAPAPGAAGTPGGQ